MSGAQSIARTDLDGLSISQVRFLPNLHHFSCQLLAWDAYLQHMNSMVSYASPDEP